MAQIYGKNTQKNLALGKRVNYPIEVVVDPFSIGIVPVANENIYVVERIEEI